MKAAAIVFAVWACATNAHAGDAEFVLTGSGDRLASWKAKLGGVQGGPMYSLDLKVRGGCQGDSLDSKAASILRATKSEKLAVITYKEPIPRMITEWGLNESFANACAESGSGRQQCKDLKSEFNVAMNSFVRNGKKGDRIEIRLAPPTGGTITLITADGTKVVPQPISEKLAQIMPYFWIGKNLPDNELKQLKRDLLQNCRTVSSDRNHDDSDPH